MDSPAAAASSTPTSTATVAAAKPVISMDSPHAVDTGAACAHCFALKPDLLRCSACMHAWYCNQDCQRAAFKEHKQFCKALRTFNKLHADLPQDIRPGTPQEFYQQRQMAARMLEQLLKRPLTRAEMRALINEAKCSVCMKTRDQAAPDRLVCCPRCSWAWACPQHAAKYHSKGHSFAECDQYHVMNTAHLWVRNMLKVSGKLPSYCPDTLPPAYSPLPSQGWDIYKEWRPCHKLDPAVFAVLSKRLSQPLTTLLALQHFYTPEELGRIPTLVIHVVGAGGFEVPADTVWEELVHLTPGGVTGVHVDFVGPEIEAIILPEQDGNVVPLTVCKDCKPRGHARSYSYNMCTYHAFLRRRAAAGLELAPHLVVAFNSGMHDDEREQWQPTVEALVSSGARVAFTSYNREEAEGDAKMWRAAGGTISLGPCENPYRALEPIMEPGLVGAFYYQSYYWFCGRGNATPPPTALAAPIASRAAVTAPSTANTTPTAAGHAEASPQSTTGDDQATSASRRAPGLDQPVACGTPAEGARSASARPDQSVDEAGLTPSMGAVHLDEMD